MIAPDLRPPTDWHIKHECDTYPDGEGGSTFGEWWVFTDGKRTFKCDFQDDAELLANMMKLARFGAWAAGEFRRSFDDVDGGHAQDAMERCGVLVKRHVTESCGETCTCAEWGDFPQDCYKFPPGVAQIVKECGK